MRVEVPQVWRARAKLEATQTECDKGELDAVVKFRTEVFDGANQARATVNELKNKKLDKTATREGARCQRAAAEELEETAEMEEAEEAEEEAEADQASGGSGGSGGGE